MITITDDMFWTILKPLLISSIIGTVFFAFSIQSILKYNLTGAGICGYLIAIGIMYAGITNMETTLIDMGIINTRIYLSVVMTGFYLILLMYILSQRPKEDKK